MYIARYSNHIQQDITRNWSSWNFGEEGINATEEQIESWKEEAIANDSPFFISGFELYGKEIQDADIRELYPNYWVLVDNTNGCGEGIFGVQLNAQDLENAILESNTVTFDGEGYKFNAEEAKLVWSSANNDVHIFEI